MKFTIKIVIAVFAAVLGLSTCTTPPSKRFLSTSEQNLSTELINASMQGNTDNVEILLAKGADVNAKMNNEWTVLMVASMEGHTEIVKILLEKGADVNIKTKDGWTALMGASEKGYTEIVKILLAKGADANIIANNGVTALILASGGGHTEVVRLLLAGGADVNISVNIDNVVITALIAAREMGHEEVARILEQAVASSAPDSKLNTHMTEKQVVDLMKNLGVVVAILPGDAHTYKVQGANLQKIGGPKVDENTEWLVTVNFRNGLVSSFVIGEY